MAERVVVVAVDGSDQADKAFNCKSFCILYIFMWGFIRPFILSNNMDEMFLSVKWR